MVAVAVAAVFKRSSSSCKAEVFAPVVVGCGQKLLRGVNHDQLELRRCHIQFLN